MIADLLTVSQLDGGGMPLSRQPVDLTGPLRSAGPRLRSAAPARRGIALATEPHRRRRTGAGGAGRPGVAPARAGEHRRERFPLHAARRTHRAVGARRRPRRDRGLQRRAQDPGRRSRAHLQQVRARRSPSRRVRAAPAWAFTSASASSRRTAARSRSSTATAGQRRLRSRCRELKVGSRLRLQASDSDSGSGPEACLSVSPGCARDDAPAPPTRPEPT